MRSAFAARALEHDLAEHLRAELAVGVRDLQRTFAVRVFGSSIGSMNATRPCEALRSGNALSVSVAEHPDLHWRSSLS